VRFILIAFVSITLAGCWIGKSLYSNADARPAIPPGVYRLTGPDEPTKVYRVSMLPNGLTQFDSGEKKETYGFAPLDSGRGTYVAWLDLKPDGAGIDLNDDVQIYALVARQSNGEFLIVPPECNDEEAEMARKAGAAVETGTAPACRFPDRRALEKAMRLLPRDDKSTLRLARIR
jgi:hypothetical protein